MATASTSVTATFETRRAQIDLHAAHIAVLETAIRAAKAAISVHENEIAVLEGQPDPEPEVDHTVPQVGDVWEDPADGERVVVTWMVDDLPGAWRLVERDGKPVGAES